LSGYSIPIPVPSTKISTLKELTILLEKDEVITKSIYYTRGESVMKKQAGSGGRAP
jgi:hypothetical protein